MFYFCKYESEKEPEANDTAFKNFLVIQFKNKYLIKHKNIIIHYK